MNQEEYFEKAEKAYLGILNAQTACGYEMGAAMADPSGFDAEAFRSALRMGMRSISYYTDRILSLECPPGMERYCGPMRDYARFMQAEISSRLTEVCAMLPLVDDQEKAGHVLTTFIEIMGDDRVEEHIARLERTFPWMPRDGMGDGRP